MRRSACLLAVSALLFLNIATGRGEECSVESEEEERTIPLGDVLSEISARFERDVADNKLLAFFSESGESQNMSPFILRKRAVLYALSFSWLFKDLNNLVWRYPSIDFEKDPMAEYKQLVNKHTEEDGSHWKMFQHDWRKLGLDEGSTTPSQTAEFFFSQFTEASRAAIYDMIYFDGLLDGKRNVIGRYVIMASLEFAGHHLFAAIESDYDKYLRETNGYELRYVGSEHSDLESGAIHTEHSEKGEQEGADAVSAEDKFAALNVTQSEHRQFLDVSAKVLHAITEKHWVAKYEFVKERFQHQQFFNSLLR